MSLTVSVGFNGVKVDGVCPSEEGGALLDAEYEEGRGKDAPDQGADAMVLPALSAGMVMAVAASFNHPSFPAFHCAPALIIQN